MAFGPSDHSLRRTAQAVTLLAVTAACASVRTPPSPPPAREKRGQVVEIGGAWCEACQRLKTTTLRDARVVRALAGFDWLSLDVDPADARSDAIVARYGVAEMPALRIYDERQHLLVRIDGYVDAETLLRALGKPARPFIVRDQQGDIQP